MKTNRTPEHAAAASFAPAFSPSATRPEDDRTLADPAPGGSVRLLLGLDVPEAVLPDIEADWARINDATNNAPDLVPAMVAVALGRVQRVAVRVAGVAVAERRANPLTAWRRSAA